MGSHPEDVQRSRTVPSSPPLTSTPRSALYASAVTNPLCVRCSAPGLRCMQFRAQTQQQRLLRSWNAGLPFLMLVTMQQTRSQYGLQYRA